MSGLEFFREFFASEGIELFGALPLDVCKLIRPYLLDRCGVTEGSAVVFAVPYYSPMADAEGRNVSVYAVPRDYHLYFKELYGRFSEAVKREFPAARFELFSDHSPIDEVNAAARCGLGIIGKNHLLITEKYSSFVFLGEIVTDIELPYIDGEIRYCEDCGLCSESCHVALKTEECLSALTQKKGGLTKEEEERLLRHGLVWGCDDCQLACPHTAQAIRCGTVYSPVSFFSEACAPVLTAELVEKMSDEEFSRRAYAWRGRETVLRNLRIAR